MSSPVDLAPNQVSIIRYMTDRALAGTWSHNDGCTITFGEDIIGAVHVRLIVNSHGGLRGLKYHQRPKPTGAVNLSVKFEINSKSTSCLEDTKIMITPFMHTYELQHAEHITS